MSYAGPPSQAEMNRNRGRNHHNNVYETGNSSKQQRTFEAQPSQNQNLNHENRVVGTSGGFGGRGNGAVMMSYSPPKDRIKEIKKQKKGKTSKPLSKVSSNQGIRN